MVNHDVSTFLLFLESISDCTNASVISAITSATNAIFESDERDAKKEYILSIMEYIDSDGNVDYSGTEVPPKDIEEKLKSYGITTDELIEARKAYDQFQNIKSTLY